MWDDSLWEAEVGEEWQKILPFSVKKKEKKKEMLHLARRFSDVAAKLQRIHHLSQATSTLSVCMAVWKKLSA